MWFFFCRLCYKRQNCSRKPGQMSVDVTLVQSPSTVNVLFDTWEEEPCWWSLQPASSRWEAQPTRDKCILTVSQIYSLLSSCPTNPIKDYTEDKSSRGRFESDQCSYFEESHQEKQRCSSMFGTNTRTVNSLLITSGPKTLKHNIRFLFTNSPAVFSETWLACSQCSTEQGQETRKYKNMQKSIRLLGSVAISQVHFPQN